MFETFEHTADLGLRVQGQSKTELFTEAARGLFSMVVENLDEVAQRENYVFDVPGVETDYLLFDWLNDLLYFYETEHVLLSRFDVTIGPEGLQGTAWGEPADDNRHTLAHEVKAITYHQLSVTESETGWNAELIVDI